MKRYILLALLLTAAVATKAQDKERVKDSLICDETHMVWKKNTIKVMTVNELIYKRLFDEEKQIIHRIEIDMDYSEPRYCVIFRQRYESDVYDFFKRLELNPIYPR